MTSPWCAITPTARSTRASTGMGSWQRLSAPASTMAVASPCSPTARSWWRAKLQRVEQRLRRACASTPTARWTPASAAMACSRPAIGSGDDIAFSITVQPDGKILVGRAKPQRVEQRLRRACASMPTARWIRPSTSAIRQTLDGAPTFVEDGPAVVLDADVDVSDAELDALNGGLGNYAGASLTLVRNGGAVDGRCLRLQRRQRHHAQRR